MSSKVKHYFSEAHFHMKSRFSPNLVMVIYGKAIHGNAIYGKAIYGKAIYGKAIHGNAIWQPRCNGRPETFFKNFTMEKVTLK